MNYLEYFSINSIVILSFFAISFIVIVLDRITNGKSNDTFFKLKRGSPMDIMTYIRLLTYPFGHSGWTHFAGNFSYILLIGPLLEEKYGSIELLIMMISTTLIIGLFHIITSKDSALGASGIVYMMIVLASFVNIKAGKIPITLILILLIHVISEFEPLIIQKKNDNTNHVAHLVGAFTGLLYGIMYMHGYTIIGFISKYLNFSIK